MTRQKHTMKIKPKEHASISVKKKENLNF